MTLAERRAMVKRMSDERHFQGPAWAVYLTGRFHCGVFWLRKEADEARLSVIERQMGWNNEMAPEFHVGRRYWQGVVRVARVSVVATPTRSPSVSP